MDLDVDLSDRADRAGALYRALREEVRRGRLRPGDRLPASRALAQDLGVSRNTVATVYERLTAEGFLESRVGSGTYVTASAAEPRAGSRTATLRPRADWRWAPQRVSGQRARPPYDFRVGIPDPSLFPFDTWRRLLAAETRRGADPGTYQPPGGLPALREAVARHLAYSRGVTADPDDVVVTQGTQQALDLVARVLLAPGDVVAVEDPGYPVARALLASHRADVVPVPVDEEGMVVDAVPESARLVLTTPSHQFPLGVPLSLARRRALLAHAERHDAAVVEDDYDSEFRYLAHPLETLHGLDETGRVVYVGTFSKSLLPSLRLGYLVCPPSIREAVLAARQLADGYGPVHLQAALARFLDEGLLARHVRKAAKVYGDRRELLVEELDRLPVDRLPSAAGLHLAALLEDGLDAARVMARAAAEGIAVEALSGYGDHPRPGLVFGYGATVTESIRPGIRRLARLLADG